MLVSQDLRDCLLSDGLMDDEVGGLDQFLPSSSNSRSTAKNNNQSIVTRHEIDDALAGIANEDKLAFLYALEHVPDLIAIESHPAKFLLREDFNVSKAIKRLCLYWKCRYENFGPDRAFLPMTLCGDGAMDQDAIEAFQSGPMIPLQGPDALYYADYDHILLFSRAIRRKMHFYTLQVLSEVSLHFYTSCMHARVYVFCALDSFDVI